MKTQTSQVHPKPVRCRDSLIRVHVEVQASGVSSTAHLGTVPGLPPPFLRPGWEAPVRELPSDPP